MAETGAPVVRTILLQAVGYLFLALGLLGMVLPILQGFLFLAIGMIILAKTAPWAKRLLERFRKRHPRIGTLIDQAEVKVETWGRKVVEMLGRKS